MHIKIFNGSKYLFNILCFILQRPGEFNWDETKQGIVLGSFFYGYVLTQVPGGRLAELFGGKLVYGLGVLVTALFTFLSPIAARINFPLFIIVRILEGMGEVSNCHTCFVIFKKLFGFV